MATQQMSTQQNQFLRYNTSVETIQPNEEQIFQELAVIVEPKTINELPD